MISAVFCVVRKICFISLMLLFVSGLFSFVQAQTKTSKSTFIVIGTGEVLKENITAAREQAISNSLVSAVGLAAAEFIPVDSLITNGEALDKILFSRAKKYVQGYKVLSEIRSDKAYRVTVQVKVSADRVKKRLGRAGLLRAKKKSPKILFFIAEQNTQEQMPRYWWGNNMAFNKSVSEKAISEVMKAKGIRVVEHGLEIQKMAVRNIENSPELNIRSAANLAAKLKTDVFGIGKSIASTTPNSMGDGRSFKGTVVIDVFRTKSMKKIASANRTAITANTDEAAGSRDALKSAGSLIANDLSSQIIASLEKVSQDASRVEIFLEGTSNLANFVMFRRMLKKVQGVNDIQVRELKSDNATLNIKYRGSTKKLADSLMLNVFETFGINIYEIQETKLRIKLIPNKI